MCGIKAACDTGEKHNSCAPPSMELPLVMWCWGLKQDLVCGWVCTLLSEQTFSYYHEHFSWLFLPIFSHYTTSRMKKCPFCHCNTNIFFMLSLFSGFTINNILEQIQKSYCSQSYNTKNLTGSINLTHSNYWNILMYLLMHFDLIPAEYSIL